MITKLVNWKKFLAALLAGASMLTFTGCGGGSDDSSSDSSAESSDDTSGENTSVHKVGYILRESAEDFGFAAEIVHQRERASNRSSVDTVYIDNVSVSEFEKAVKKLADDGCTDIVSGSATYANVLGTVARNYLDLNFVNFGAMSDSLNVTAYSEAPYQGAYVAGLAADFNSKTKKIGVVADTSLDMVVPVVNAIQLGSQLNQDGGSEVYVSGAAAKNEIEQAVDSLLAQDCDVIVCYTCSGYSADYCEKKGVKYIGSLDYNGKEDDYPNMIMYFCARRDNYFLAQFKSLKMNTWESDTYIGEMGNGIINVSPALKASADGTQKLMDALVPYVTEGSARPFKGVLRDTDGNVKQIETDELSEREIANMSWYVENVYYVENFRVPQTEIDSNDFEIKS